MKTLYLILLLIGAVFFVLAMFLPTPVPGSTSPLTRVNLVAAGLLSWILVDLIKQFDLVTD